MADQNWGTKKAGSFVAARFSEKSLGIMLLFAAIGIPLVRGLFLLRLQNFRWEGGAGGDELLIGVFNYI